MTAVRGLDARTGFSRWLRNRGTEAPAVCRAHGYRLHFVVATLRSTGRILLNKCSNGMEWSVNSS